MAETPQRGGEEGAADPDWAPRVTRSGGPIYLAIAEALEADIGSGRLAPGARLPPQRSLAHALGVDFTTVTRAYAEARRRGLVVGKVGQGTFVVGPAATARATPGGMIEMNMNMPPVFDDPALTQRLWRGIDALQAKGGLPLLLRYADAAGAGPDRAAGARWLSRRLPGVEVDRVLVCPGAQVAFLGILGALTRPGDVVLAEALTYPRWIAAAAHMGVTLEGLPADDQGIDPDAFEAACRQYYPKALYCNPTLQNPTTATMSLERRQAVIAVARKHGVPIIEDDAYGLLPRTTPPPIAALAPDITFYVATLSKCLSPALRIAYLVLPDTAIAGRVTENLLATVLMASPLSAAIASQWIGDGTAEAMLEAIRKETRARQALAARVLAPGSYAADPDGFLLWLPLPAGWRRERFAAHLRAQGINVVVADHFCIRPPIPEAVRATLSAPDNQADTLHALELIRDALAQPPATSGVIV